MWLLPDDALVHIIGAVADGPCDAAAAAAAAAGVANRSSLSSTARSSNASVVHKRSKRKWEALATAPILVNLMQAIRDLQNLSATCTRLRRLIVATGSPRTSVWTRLFRATRQAGMAFGFAGDRKDRSFLIGFWRGVDHACHKKLIGPTDAASARSSARLFLFCWLRSHPSSFAVKKELLADFLAMGQLDAARLLAGQMGRTQTTFRYKQSVCSSWRRPRRDLLPNSKSIRRDINIYARGRAGLTLAQAVICRYRLLYIISDDESGVNHASIANSLRFLREECGVTDLNERSLGGKTTMDIAYEIYAYWHRPWVTRLFCGNPGSGRYEKQFAVARGSILEETIKYLRQTGARCGHPGRDLLIRIRELDVNGAKGELSTISSRGAESKYLDEFRAASNHRGLTALPFVIDSVGYPGLGDPIDNSAGDEKDEQNADEESDGDLISSAHGEATSGTNDHGTGPSSPSKRQTISRASAIVQDLLDSGYNPDDLALLFDNSGGWWDRDRTTFYADWEETHSLRFLQVLDGVLTRLSGRARELCFGSVALQASIERFLGELPDETYFRQYSSAVIRGAFERLGTLGGLGLGSGQQEEEERGRRLSRSSGTAQRV
ncbi:hypothetical protein HK405_005847 [Cladochytrium tenue]|nr:hypothetical protein HK405_005847 [Cladochytrium tenue]